MDADSSGQTLEEKQGIRIISEVSKYLLFPNIYQLQRVDWEC